MTSESGRAGSRAEWSSLERFGFLVLLPLGATLLLALLVPVPHAWGWDESMHAELPAVRMLFALQAGNARGFFEALHSCEQYPFVWPLVLAVAQAIFGVGESVARAAGWGAFALLLALVHIGARELERAPGSRVAGPLARHLAPIFALLAPLVLAYATTLFLEVPCAAAIAAALVVWVRFHRESERAHAARWALFAGALATVVFFTKFNYGLLFAAGLALDLVQRLATAPRDERRALLRATPWLLAVPALALAWWLVLPLPFGAATAASHRAALAGFLGGNLQMASAPWTTRVLDLCGYLPGSPLQALVLLVGSVATLPMLRVASVRTTWILLLALEPPALLHPFHLDRFLVPGAPMAWLLAALGWSALIGRARGLRLTLAAACFLGWASAPQQLSALAGALGVLPADGPARDPVRNVLSGWVHPDPRRRNVPTAGLLRAELEVLLDRLASEIGPDERVGWPAIPSEVSPAVLHLGLLQRGGSRERFLTQAHQPIFLSIAHAGEGISLENTAAWAASFDVLILTEPPDLKGRAGREWLRAHQTALVEGGGWKAERVGELVFTRAPATPMSVVLSLARRSP